jgi:ATP synthase F1 delta subunit
MSDRRVAKRYAEGFLAFAKDTIGAKNGLEELIRLGEILEKSPDLLKFLKNPEISYSQKAEFIEKTFKGLFSEETREFIKLVVEKHRSEEAAI